MNEIQNLNLSESDFKMINDGLESLPSRDLAGDVMMSILGAAFLKDDPAEKQKFLDERKSEEAKKKREKELLIEEVRILQGKMLMLQRFLRMNGLLDDAKGIIHK